MSWKLIWQPSIWKIEGDIMNRDDYIHSSTSIRVYEKRLLKREDYYKIINAEGEEELLKAFEELGYKTNNVERTYEGIEELLMNELVNLFRDMYKKCKDKEVVEIAASQYRFHDLKVIVRSFVSGEDFSDLMMRVLDYDYEPIISDLKEYGKVSTNKKYAEYINNAIELYNETKDPQKLDMLMDKYRNDETKILVDRLNIEYMNQYFKEFIDLENLETVTRAKKQNKPFGFIEEFLSDYGEIPVETYKRLYPLEISDLIQKLKGYGLYKAYSQGRELYDLDGKLSHFSDEKYAYLNEISLEGKKTVFGPEVIFAYIKAKATEIRTLRIIVVGKRSGLTKENLILRVGDLVA